MIRSIEPIRNEEIFAKGKEYFFSIKDFDNVDLSVPDDLKVITKISTKILVACFFWLLFIPVIWFFVKRNKLSQILNNRIKIGVSEDDYNSFLKKDASHFNKLKISGEKNPILVNVRNNAVKSFHYGSSIDEESWTNLEEISFYNKYTFSNQEVYIRYHYYVQRTYVDSKGRTRTTTVRENRTWRNSIATGLLDAFKDDKTIISANSRVRGADKYKLENRDFNKEYKIRTNDKIASNMMFTPLTQEYFVNLGGFKSFEIHGNLFMAFDQYSGSFLITDDINYKIKDFKKGIDHIKEISYEKFINPLLNINSLYSNLLAAPIWKPKKKNTN